jgi:chloride channel 7
MLSGMVRSTASVCVIILEISNNMNTLPMIMLTILVAKATADFTGIEALFDMIMRTRRLPYLEANSERFYR